MLLVLQFHVIYFFVYLFILLYSIFFFFFFFFFTNSSEIHWFIHSRGFAVQFGRNHVLSTKKNLANHRKGVFLFTKHSLPQ